MNRLTKKRSGFTLIEILVVLIIVGVLASIALPNLFSNISKSRSAQALATMSGYKVSLEACAQLHPGETVGGTGSLCTLANQNLNAGPINGWSYSIPAGTAPPTAAEGTTVAPTGNITLGTLTYTLRATDGTNTITLTRGAGGTWTCSTGLVSPYTGVC